MRKIYDRKSMARTLALDLDPTLHALLADRFAALVTETYDLTDWTEYLVVEPGDREADIIRELSFSLLIEPIDGARFGGAGFMPYWDYLTRHGHWFEMTISFGSAFAYVVLIQDTEGVDPLLLAMCRHYVGDARCG